MNLKHLFYFRNLADLEHFGQASRAMDISQPSLSYAMSNLEKEVGVKLFKRKGRNVALTTQGRVFRIFVEQALDTLESGVSFVRSIKDEADEDALILLYDNRIERATVEAAAHYLESTYEGKEIIALPVPEKDAKAFVEQGLANFELVQQQRDAVIKSNRETLPFKFEKRNPAVRLSSDAHFRNQSLLS